MRIGWLPKSRDANIASVRFRCLTPLAALQAMGVDAELYEPARADRYDLVVFSKLYDARMQHTARELHARGCRTALDLSDNHFYNPNNLPAYVAAARDQRAMIALVDRVICCSEALAQIVTEKAKPVATPLVVGDAVEAFDITRAPRDETTRLLWFGSHGSPNAPAGMEDVLRLREPLSRFSQERRFELVIASNNKEKFDALRGAIDAPTRYVEWAPTTFAAELARADAVVVPVNANPFTRCKSNNRVATALWHGVPVLADAIPAYEELSPFAVLDQWDAGLAALADGALAKRTAAGSAYVRAKFNSEAVAHQWRAACAAIL